ncbi:MAG: bifunctional pyr operon transcriptional regulator/uracil phosphoribosyltransferase PyrR [Desulfovibrionaceae bacterium]|nr:bifunctional pyr operon transcriptional regulator/uracil phosphoribosyltransferase PyrR [Desulfovibrionaceae bacterium]
MTAEHVLMDAEEISFCLERLALEVRSRRGADGAPLALVGIRRRGVYLADRLGRLLHGQLGLDLLPAGVLDINLYRDDWSTLGPRAEVGRTTLDFEVNGSSILLVDDVLYTGRTTHAAMEALADYGRPRRLELLVLVDRGLRELPIQADYIGLKAETLPDERVDVHLQELDKEDRVVLRRA